MTSLFKGSGRYLPEHPHLQLRDPAVEPAVRRPAARRRAAGGHRGHYISVPAAAGWRSRSLYHAVPGRISTDTDAQEHYKDLC